MVVTTRERLEDNCDPSVEVSYVMCKMDFNEQSDWHL